MIVISLLIISVSCNRKSNNAVEIINFSEPESADILYKAADHINIIQLDSSVLIGSNPELIIGDTCYYLVDKNTSGKIFRFSQSGRFLNAIGNKGRGPEEYADIRNVRLYGDTLFIVSPPGVTVLEYLADGTFISKKQYDINARQAIKCRDGYLAYSGYGMTDTGRFILFENNSTVKRTFLKSDYNVINFTEETNVFSLHGDNIYTRESYCDTIYKLYGDSKLEPYLKIDFGKYKIPGDFFGFNDSFKAAEFLLKREFCVIRKYFESDNISVVEGMINKPPLPLFFYGIKNGSQKKNKWLWVSLGEINAAPFCNSLSAVKGKKMIFLGNASLRKNLSAMAIEKIINKDVFNKINEESNYFIAEIILK